MKISDGLIRYWNKIKEKVLLEYSLKNIDCYIDENNDDIEVEWKVIHDNLIKITNIVPSSKNNLNSPTNNTPWNSRALKRRRKAKEKFWSIFYSDPTNFNLNIALNKKKFLRVCKTSQNQIRKKCGKLKNNNKGFYAYLRNRRKIKLAVTGLEKSDGTKANTSHESAEVLAETMSAVYTEESVDKIPEFTDRTNKKMDNIAITHNDVLKELKFLNIYKAGGSDTNYPKLLKTLKKDADFVNSLTIL